MIEINIIILFLFLKSSVATLHLSPGHAAFDPKLYKEALDPELCAEHLDFITANINLHIKFLDRGLRLPKSITEGNMVDFGSYHGCLAIKEKTTDDFIQGKYCMINVPLSQDLTIPSLPEFPNWPDLPISGPNITGTNNVELIKNYNLKLDLWNSNGDITDDRKQTRSAFNIDVALYSVKMAMCLPKPCTTREAMDKLYFNLSSIGFKFEEDYCRLPDDKPWAPADTVATVILSLIGLVTILSTSYDIHHCIIRKRDPKEANISLRAFSVYTNTRRLLTFNKVPGAIECIDGIRALAMTWVILGHAFVTIPIGGTVSNQLDRANWTSSAKSLWVSSFPITVDTFFTISGLLLVYTTAGKMTGVGLLKSLHFFYLNRLLRLFPLLAFTVLLQISTFHRVADGPRWQLIEYQVNSCRTYWWTNFLYIQNYANPDEICLNHTWYLAVDMQLYIISPLVLYWVLSGKKLQAWIGLIAGIVITMTASTIYIFLTDISEADYYMNTLTRASPFFIGMIYGYILSLGCNKKIHIPMRQVLILWTCAAVLAGSVIYTFYYESTGVNNQTIVKLINATIRPAWAMAVGWMILACTHGYGGVLTWILTLPQMKLISRLSYSMYLIHAPIMFVYVASAVTPFYFDVFSWLYIFVSHFAASFICGFIMTVLVDSPASVFMRFLRGGAKKSPPAALTKNNNNIVNKSDEV